MKDTLIVISGGGFSQLENALGCLKAIEDSGRVELHSKVNTDYQGTSAGAIAAGMLAAPMTADSAITMIRNTPVDALITKKWFWPARMWFGDKAVYDRSGLESFMKNIYKDSEYANVTVTVTRQTSLTPEYMSASYQSILAGSSIEGIFPATSIGRVKYIDGGYTDNVPLKDWQLPEYRHTYVILCPDDPNKPRHQNTLLGRLLSGLDAKISQEIDEAELTYSDRSHYPRVTLLRPFPTTTSLLSWSDDYKLIGYSYKYAVARLQKEGLWK